MAARIIAARPFRSADHLKRVSCISEKEYAQIWAVFSMTGLNQDHRALECEKRAQEDSNH